MTDNYKTSKGHRAKYSDENNENSKGNILNITKMSKSYFSNKFHTFLEEIKLKFPLYRGDEEMIIHKFHFLP